MSITTRVRRLAGVVIVTTMASLAAAVVGVTAAAGPAQAVCDEVHNPTAINIVVGGVVVGREEAQSTETCGANNVYFGRIKDTRTDGSCLSVRYRDAGVTSTQATSCDSAGTRYTFNDRNGDLYSYFRGQLTATGAQSQEYLNVGY